MTKLFETAIAKVRSLPDERQDEAAEVLMTIVDQDPNLIQLTPGQQAQVKRILSTPADTVSHHEVRALFDKPTL